MATYYVDSNTSSVWVASAVISLGARRVPTRAYATAAAKGFVLECTVAGTSAATEPVWPTTDAGTVVDGGVTWTARIPNTIANATAFYDYIHNNRVVSGDRVWFRNTHSESFAAAITYVARGTAANPIELLCAGVWQDNPASLGTGAVIANTGSGNSMTFTGCFAYVHGITLRSGGFILLGINGEPTSWYLMKCLLNLVGTDVIHIRLGAFGGSSNDDQSVVFDDTQVQFGATTQSLTPRCRFEWRNTISAVLGTVPTALIIPTESVPSDTELSGLDLTALGAGKSVFNVAGATPSRISARNCSLGAGANITTGTIPGQGGAIVVADNVTSSAINYSEYKQSYEGTMVQETTIVKTGGQSDGTTALSSKMVSSAGTKFYAPLYSRWMPVWIDTTGVAKTITIDLVHDSLTALNDKEAWVEVSYLSSATTPIESRVSDSAADLLATGVAQDASTATWTTTGLTNPNKQKLVSPSFTTQIKGYAMARVALAKPSYTIYVDSNPVVA